MKSAFFFSVLALAALPAYAQQSSQISSQQTKPKTDTQMMASKGATIVVRQGAGAAIGGSVGKVIAGGPVGTALGIVFTPTKIGCGERETCR